MEINIVINLFYTRKITVQYTNSNNEMKGDMYDWECNGDIRTN